jgi:hypothetical protein
MTKLSERQYLDKRVPELKEEFLNSPYDRQVQLYHLALRLEYYEALTELVKLLPELPEEFLDDVEKLNK